MTGWIRAHSFGVYVFLAYTISWSFQLPLALEAQGMIRAQIPYWLHYVASFGPLLSALIVVAITEGRTGIRQLLGRLLKWRVKRVYYAFSVGVPLALFAIAVGVTLISTGAWPDLSLLGRVDYLPYLGAIPALGWWLVTFGLGEEVGWRGFALPYLQQKWPAGASSLILGAIWACWHLPAFFYRDTFIAMGLLGFPMFTVSILFVSVIFVWLYNSTGGSLLLVALFHGVFNWLSTSDAGGPSAAVIMSLPVMLWAVFVLRRYTHATLSPLEKQTA
jgi:membrane protease YdiL (CAAX protease family)